MSEMKNAASGSILGVMREKSCILGYFVFFVNIAFNRA